MANEFAINALQSLADRHGIDVQKISNGEDVVNYIEFLANQDSAGSFRIVLDTRCGLVLMEFIVPLPFDINDGVGGVSTKLLPLLLLGNPYVTGTRLFTGCDVDHGNFVISSPMGTEVIQRELDMEDALNGFMASALPLWKTLQEAFALP